MENSERYGNMAIIINRDGMGSAHSELRHKLMGTWLGLVEENGKLPGAICFYAEGVRLVCEGSPFLDRLQTLEDLGVHLIVCKTCLDFLELSGKVKVGIVGGMGDIIAAQWTADKVVTL
jgi:hypothetical protein